MTTTDSPPDAPDATDLAQRVEEFLAEQDTRVADTLTELGLG